MTTILNGALGGLLVGLVAGAVGQFGAAGPPAPAAVLTRAVGTRRSSARWLTAAVHLVYGAFAGGLLVALELYVLDVLGVPPSLADALGVAVVWALLLLAVTVGLQRALSPPSSDRPIRDLVIYHLVYGVGLGAWIRLTWIT
jgi:hypothetical protein